jgi:small subunit ribosomal protein S19
MSRSSWKIPYIFSNVKPRFCEEGKSLSRVKNIKIENRATVITPMFIGQTVHIANGLYFVPVMVTEGHVGFKFGAFALTKKRARFK